VEGGAGRPTQRRASAPHRGGPGRGGGGSREKAATRPPRSYRCSPLSSAAAAYRVAADPLHNVGRGGGADTYCNGDSAAKQAVAAAVRTQRRAAL
jgi:hypothetical protein